MKLAAWTTLIFGILMVVGGVMGYAQARSFASLIAGLVSGLLLLGTGWLTLQGRIEAAYASAVLTFLLAILFAYRFIATGHFMPSGMLLLFSFFALFLVLLGLFLGLRQ